ncbi:response regulator [Cohnella endophytica]|uniref:Response regulator n=1 Tax=Cohnella endophytica TaxID=2419778 RepID=A0A494XNY4_9BACL|nr:response regulator [Cohnella endophytica]RKP51502.1 response regulator [Cohnella endophytica]
MRVLIVDDEPLVRIGIKSCRNWESHGIEIVGEAEDGEKAIQSILELLPDVVILDIKMPKKNGLQVLEEVRQQGLETKIIILSSFDDLANVKSAMKLGASDYFYKPSMSGELIADMLIQLKDELDATKISPVSRLENKARSKEDGLRQWLNGQPPASLQTNLKESNMLVALFTVRHYRKAVNRYPDQNGSHLLQNAILNIMAELLAKEKEVEGLRSEENRYVVILSNSEIKSEQESRNRLNELIAMISSSLRRFINVETVFGISGFFQSFQELNRAYEQAKQAINHKFYKPEEYVLNYPCGWNEDPSVLDTASQHIMNMKTHLKEGQFEQYQLYRDNWEQLLREKPCMTETDVKKVYEGLLFILDESDAYFKDTTLAKEIENLAELTAFYRNLFREKMEARNRAFIRQEYSPIIKSILNYLHASYKREISLEHLGEQFNASGNYISKLFRKEVGKGLFDYLNDLRIARAKELLKDYKHKIYEVAEQVGFKSQVHFAIVFNKYVGMSPKEFRKQTEPPTC